MTLGNVTLGAANGQSIVVTVGNDVFFRSTPWSCATLLTSYARAAPPGWGDPASNPIGRSTIGAQIADRVTLLPAGAVVMLPNLEAQALAAAGAATYD